MWNKNNHAAKGKGTFEFDLSAERMKDFSAVKAQKSEPSKLAKGLLGLCAFLASAHNSQSDSMIDGEHTPGGHRYDDYHYDYEYRV